MPSRDIFWRFLRPKRDVPHRAVVGIFALARGGSNFLGAALHYHPRVFTVTEKEKDYRRPLDAYWNRLSVFWEHGRQDKRPEDVSFVVFNKLLEVPHLWNLAANYPQGTRFLFYLRNPIRVHLSREAYRQRRKPKKLEWADSDANFLALLTEAKGNLDAYAEWQKRHPCMLLSHEYFCWEHAPALDHLHRFLGLEPAAPSNPLDFFRHCGRCGRPFGRTQYQGQEWLCCPRHRTPVRARGDFNPLRPIDREGIRNDSWKQIPGIDRRMLELRRYLGTDVADYFWTGNYCENLAPCRRSVSRAA